jgi:hypothetical protein
VSINQCGPFLKNKNKNRRHNTQNKSNECVVCIPFTDRVKVFALEIDREAERSETLNMNDVDNFILYVYV